MKLLYAEDEFALSEAVADVLKFHKYNVDAVFDGQDALDYINNENYDGIILDIMMPKLNGLEVLKEIRKNGNKTPVLLLTAKSEIEDKIEGLDLGADDYLSKPFAMGELIARVRAMLRRKENFTPDIITFGDLALNMQNYILTCGDNSISLPKIEYQIMELFMLNKGICLSTETILSKVWGYDTDTEIGAVWVYISYLRKHLITLKSSVSITAKRNTGYFLEVSK